MTSLAKTFYPWSLGALASLGVAVLARQWLTALMSLHMLVQLPLLVLAGFCAQRAWRLRQGAPLGAEHQLNYLGIPGLLFLSLVGAGWMIPKALDDALTDWRMALAKYLGLPLCGWLLAASSQRANTVIKVFFLGNFCWMSAIVGMQYTDMPQRLCNAYLLEDQSWTGNGLIAGAILWPALWFAGLWRKHSRSGQSLV